MHYLETVTLAGLGLSAFGTILVVLAAIATKYNGTIELKFGMTEGQVKIVGRSADPAELPPSK